MHILSWNVNGLCTLRLVGNRASRLKREIASSSSMAVDILLLQEHKLSHPFGHLLGTGSRTIWSPAIGDFGHSCGVCISVSASYVASVVQHGILVPSKAMYVIMRIAETRIGFLSIYAPTHARARASSWDLLVETMQPLLLYCTVRAGCLGAVFAFLSGRRCMEHSFLCSPALLFVLLLGLASPAGQTLGEIG